MKRLTRWLAVIVALIGMRATAKGAQVVNTPDLTLNIGGRLQSLGELEAAPDDPIRYHTRIYLFDPEARLLANGVYKGSQFYFEEALGGEAMSNTNNQFNLLEFNGSVPLAGYNVIVGQFKVPTNLESASYEGNLLFSEHSPLLNMFFNTGYDTGLAINGKFGSVDAELGVISGAPDIPQRYLPTIFNVPPLTYLRVGIGNIKDDAHHVQQTGFAKPDSLQAAFHLNAEYAQDSNAGHSTDLSLQSGYFSTFSANGPFGNALLSTIFNPYLGQQPQNFGAVTADYYFGSADWLVRAPLGDATFVLQGQVSAAGFAAYNFAPITVEGKVVTSGQLNILGGELIAALETGTWDIAGRFAVVAPDAGMASLPSTGPKVTGTSVFGWEPIYEVTAPAITLHINENIKLVAEGIWNFSTPESIGNDGLYVMTEMPSQSNAPGSGSKVQRGFAAAGRMMFQYTF